MIDAAGPPSGDAVNDAAPAGLAALPVALVAQVAPLARRAAELDPRALVRLRCSGTGLTGFVRLPFGVLAGCTFTAESDLAPVDATVGCRELDEWVRRPAGDPPERQDGAWRWPVPGPTLRWQRLDRVPAGQLRTLVRQGALTLRQAAEREGVVGSSAQPRAEVSEALLETVVLDVSGTGDSARVSLRLVSALLRLGFAAPESSVAVDVAGRWLRLAGVYGSVFAERPGRALTLGVR